jgi:signal transduction histidine kinase
MADGPGRCPCVALLLLLLALAGGATAQSRVELDPASGEQPVGRGQLWRGDAHGPRSPPWSTPASGAAATHVDLPVSLGYPRDAIWLRFAVHNPSAQPVERLLLLWRGSKYATRWWIAGRDGVIERELGMGAVQVDGDRRSRHTVIALRLAPGETVQLGLRLDTRFSATLDLRLLDSAALASHEWTDQLLFGALGGFGVGLTLVVLLLGAAARERAYAWFALATCCTVGYVLAFEGVLSRWLLDAAVGDAGRAFAGVMGVVSIAAFLHFLRLLLESPRLADAADRRLLRPLLWMGWSLAALLAFWPWPWGGIAASWALFAVLVSTLIVGMMALRPPFALPGVVVAMVLYLAVTAIYVLQLLGVLPDQAWVHATRFATLMVCLLMFVHATSQKVFRRQRAQERVLRDNEERLEQKVAERTAEMSLAKTRAEKALQRLQLAQAELVEAEKMASLGQLVAGVAHEINTPVGVAYTASSHLGDRTRRLRERLAEGSLRRSDFEDYLQTAEEAARLVGGNLERAAELIRSFKQVSVDRSADGRRTFRLDEVVHALVESLSPGWKRRPLELSVECPGGIDMDSFPGALGQVLTNLVQNALLHAYAAEDSGRMRIVVELLDDDMLELRVEDDGRGIKEAHRERVFEPFFTTRRGQGGSGLGLHIAYNLVTQKLGGSIRVDCPGPSGRGCAFVLRLPRHAPECPEQRA